MNGPPLKTFRKGKGIRQFFNVKWHNWLSNFFNTLTVTGGKLITTESGMHCRLEITGGSSSFLHPFKVSPSGSDAEVTVRRGWVVVDGYGAGWSGAQDAAVAVPEGTWTVTLKIEKDSPLTMSYILQEEPSTGHSSDAFFIPLSTVTCVLVETDVYRISVDEIHQTSSVLIMNYL